MIFRSLCYSKDDLLWLKESLSLCKIFEVMCYLMVIIIISTLVF